MTAIDAEHPTTTIDASIIRSRFRRVDPERHQAVGTYTWDEIYGHGDQMAPGGLHLAAEMTATLDLVPGDIILDLACGKGDTSIFLAREFGVQVVAVDLWVSATTLATKFKAAGVGGQVTPLQLDVNAETTADTDETLTGPSSNTNHGDKTMDTTATMRAKLARAIRPPFTAETARAKVRTRRDMSANDMPIDDVLRRLQR